MQSGGGRVRAVDAHNKPPAPTRRAPSTPTHPAQQHGGFARLMPGGRVTAPADVHGDETMSKTGPSCARNGPFGAPRPAGDLRVAPRSMRRGLRIARWNRLPISILSIGQKVTPQIWFSLFFSLLVSRLLAGARCTPARQTRAITSFERSDFK